MSNQPNTLNISENAFTYDDYREALDTMLLNGQSTETSLINYEDDTLVELTKLNVARMQRLDKTNRLTDDLRNAARKLNRDVVCLLFTEGWCGEAAHSVPIIAEMAGVTPNIDLRLILRDNNPKVMDKFSEHDNHTIPKLIVLDAFNYEHLATWGPRPKVLEEMIPQIKVDVQDSKESFSLEIQKWYNKDKGKHIMKELTQLLNSITV